ncbi:hypothetical protein D3C73_1209030 [compost metagenome]
MDIGLVLRHEVIANAQQPVHIRMAVARKESGTTLGVQRSVQTLLSLLSPRVIDLAQAGNQIQLGLFLQPDGDRAAIGCTIGLAVGGVWSDFLFLVLLCLEKHGQFAVMAERITVFEHRTGQRLAR